MDESPWPSASSARLTTSRYQREKVFRLRRNLRHESFFLSSFFLSAVLVSICSTINPTLSREPFAQPGNWEICGNSAKSGIRTNPARPRETSENNSYSFSNSALPVYTYTMGSPHGDKVHHDCSRGVSRGTCTTDAGASSESSAGPCGELSRRVPATPVATQTGHVPGRWRSRSTTCRHESRQFHGIGTQPRSSATRRHAVDAPAHCWNLCPLASRIPRGRRCSRANCWRGD